MTIDSIEASGDPSDIFENWDNHNEEITWNGRKIAILDQTLTNQLIKAQSLIQSLNAEQKIQPFLNPFNLTKIDLENRAFDFASPEHEFTWVNSEQSQFEIIPCNLFKRIWDGVKKGAKKAAKVFKKVIQQTIDVVKKAAEEIAHGTKKAAEKVADFVNDHKKETLIAAAIIAAIAGAFVISGALSGGAAATAGNGTSSKRKEDEEDHTTSPPSDPPPLPDWMSEILKSTIPDFSLGILPDTSLESAKKEAHNAWNLFNHLKSHTENDLSSLKEFQADFNPSSHAVETILNTILKDSQRDEFSKNLVSSQSWADVIKSGHEKIDQAFASLSSQNQTPIAPFLPQKSSSNSLEKIQLGLEIIHRGMLEPNLLDPNSALAIFIKKEEIDILAEAPNQTVGNFLETITNAFKVNQKSFGNFIVTPQVQTSKTRMDCINSNRIHETGSSSSFAGTSSSTEQRSRYFEIEGDARSGMLVTFINGMHNLLKEAEENAKHLQELSSFNPRIDGIYNHTNGRAIDALEILLNYTGCSPTTQDLLIQKWTDFHEKNKDNPKAKILHFCHSQGAIHTKNALLRLPEEIQNRLIVVAIAPATVVSSSLCYDSFNYASKNDIVPWGGLLAAYWNACNLGETEREEMLINSANTHDELIWLTPHENATRLDHAFQSPTFSKVIKLHIEKYNEGNFK